MQLDRIKKIPLEIAYQLGQNENIQKLLINDGPSALDDPFVIKDVNTLLEEEYISIAPKIENGILHITRNTFIVISLTRFDFINAGEDNVNVDGEILIATNHSNVMLDNNTNRLFELMDLCLNLLDNQKLSVSGQINIENAQSVVVSENSFGYRISFNINEQQNERAEI